MDFEKRANQSCQTRWGEVPRGRPALQHAILWPCPSFAISKIKVLSGLTIHLLNISPKKSIMQNFDRIFNAIISQNTLIQ